MLDPGRLRLTPEPTAAEIEAPENTTNAGAMSATVAGHELTLFIETWPLIHAMLRDIRAARTRVWLETYIFHDDAAGQAVAEALCERAAAGVQVRVLYDAIGSNNTSWTFFRALQEAGVQVHAFHSVREALWRFSFLRILNRRDHRKLLIIDDTVAYFGGMNLIDTTLGARVADRDVARLGRLARRSCPPERPAAARGGREFRAHLAVGARRTRSTPAEGVSARRAGGRFGEHPIFRQRSRLETHARRPSVRAFDPFGAAAHHLLDGVFPARGSGPARHCCTLRDAACRCASSCPAKAMSPWCSTPPLSVHAPAAPPHPRLRTPGQYAT